MTVVRDRHGRSFLDTYTKQEKKSVKDSLRAIIKVNDELCDLKHALCEELQRVVLDAVNYEQLDGTRKIDFHKASSLVITRRVLKILNIELTDPQDEALLEEIVEVILSSS